MACSDSKRSHVEPSNRANVVLRLHPQLAIGRLLEADVVAHAQRWQTVGWSPALPTKGMGVAKRVIRHLRRERPHSATSSERRSAPRSDVPVDATVADRSTRLTQVRRLSGRIHRGWLPVSPSDRPCRRGRHGGFRPTSMLRRAGQGRAGRGVAMRGPPGTHLAMTHSGRGRTLRARWTVQDSRHAGPQPVPATCGRACQARSSTSACWSASTTQTSEILSPAKW